MMVTIITFLAILSALNTCIVVLLFGISGSLKTTRIAQESVQVARYQKAVETPKPKDLPGRPVVENESSNEIDLADMDFETGYEALAAYGRGES